MTKKKIILAGVCAAAVLAVAGGYLLSEKGGAAGQPTGAGGQRGPGGAMGQQASVTVVKAAAPVRGDISQSTSLTGTVEAADLVYVSAKAAGDVTSVKVKAGDLVSQGQVICEIDTGQVESAQNSMESAQVNLAQARNNLSRMQVLYGGGDLSEQEYEQYVNAVKTAQLQYESARLAYGKQMEYSKVTAPISGRVESCDVETYGRVSQSSQLCVIAGDGESRITFYVTQRMMQNLREGDGVEVYKNGNTYKGAISEISSMVDEGSGLFKVKAQVEGTDEIAIGSTVKLSLVTQRAENAMLGPVDAIYYSGGDGYVYLYQDGVAQKRQVEVGLYNSEYAEVLSGLGEEDLVVSTWSSNLYEGATVRLRDQAGDENQGQPSGESPKSQAQEGGAVPEGQGQPSGESPKGQAQEGGAVPEGQGQPSGESPKGQAQEGGAVPEGQPSGDGQGGEAPAGGSRGPRA